MTHTPGPWYGYNGFNALDGKVHCEEIANQKNGRNDHILRSSNGGDIVATAEDFALIITAPDLLASCKELLEYLMDDGVAEELWTEPYKDAVKRARENIARAEKGA